MRQTGVEQMNNSADRRLNMVNSQILTNRVTDQAVADALLAVPREAFVPKALAGIAYVDEDLHIGDQRYLMEPMILARLVQEADVGPDDLILDIGCASGYSTAVLAQLGGTVVALRPHTVARAITRLLESKETLAGCRQRAVVGASKERLEKVCRAIEALGGTV